MILGVYLGFLYVTSKQIIFLLGGSFLLIFGFILSYYLEQESEKEKRRIAEYRKQKEIEEAHEYELKKREKEIFEEGQKANGLQKVNYKGSETWATPEQVREWKYIEVDLENNFQKLSPRQFEKAIQDLFVKMNYEVTLTNYIGDYGADLIVKKDSEILVVQCKKYMEKHKVGAPEVQRTLGSMYRYNASKAILVTTSDFTNKARIQAREAPIELWNNRILREQFMKAYLTNS
jgi:restriction endonuclease Mrr